MKKLLFCVVVFSLVLFSCDLFDIEETEEELPGNFWAYDSGKKSYYRVDAELLCTGTYCTVWAEKGSIVTSSDAQKIANAYDNGIYPKMIGAFGIQLTYNGSYYSDQMKLADRLGDRNEKLCILLLDIKDNYNPISNRSYIAGYFDSVNFFTKLQYNSNECDMIYIDTYPGLTPSESSSPESPSMEELLEDAEKTLAHEMQHLMNFVTTLAKRSQFSGNVLTDISPMDTWIDEGLSSAAEWVYNGHSQYRIDWFNNNGREGESKINIGNNFFVWGNRDASLDDYATVYLFFQWLRLQKGNTNIYKDIIASTNSNHLAVMSAINYSDWDTLLKTWLAANYIRSSTGQYGYKDDSELNAITTHYVPAGTTSILLSPGEGVYSVTNSNGSTPALGNKIRYAGLDRNAFQVSNSNVYANGVLLTYNVNTDNKEDAPQESGVTTGVAASVTSAKSGSASRSVTAPFSRPIPIGIVDLSKRAQPFVFEFPINGNDGE